MNPATNYTIRSVTFTATGSGGRRYTVTMDPATGVATGCSCPRYNVGRYRGQVCKHMERAERGELGKPRVAIAVHPGRPGPIDPGRSDRGDRGPSPRRMTTIRVGAQVLTRPSRERQRPAGPVATAADLYGD